MKPKSQGRAQIVRGNESKFTLHYEPVFFNVGSARPFFFLFDELTRSHVPTYYSSS